MEFIAGFMLGAVLTIVCVLWFTEGFIRVVKEIIKEGE